MKKNKDLYIFIKDEDAKSFAVAGPIDPNDVDEWLVKEGEERNKGRRVTVMDVFEEYLVAGVQAAEDQKFILVSPNKIIVPPKDRSAEYRGSLPKYAQSADRDRVVSILCKGQCRAVRWAEMNKAYPGADALKKADMGEFKAKCLRCGSIARDNYNWTRS